MSDLQQAFWEVTTRPAKESGELLRTRSPQRATLCPDGSIQAVPTHGSEYSGPR